MSESKILGTVKLSNLGLLNSTFEQAVFDEVISLIFQKDPSELTSRQKKTALLLIYDNEINNGGHLQYFHNQGTDYVEEVLAGLEEIGANCQKGILDKAFEREKKSPVKQFETLNEYHNRAIQNEFTDLDMLYYDCSPEIGNELLPQYVRKYINEFVEIE